ncbi:MAG: hypothetical protein AB1333_02260 [Patescibacteria group bacterium]
MLKKDFKQAPEKKKKPQVYITSDEVIHAKRLLFLKKFGVGIFGFFLGIVLLVLVTGGGGILRTWVESLIQKRFITQLETLRKAPTSSEEVSPPPSPQVEIPKEAPTFLEKVTKPFFEILKKQDETLSDSFASKNLVSSSFTDLFSGVGWLDVSATNMYHDKIVTAFTLEPDFTWQRIQTDEVSQDVFPVVRSKNERADRRCIESSCLEQRGLALFFNNEEISLPREMRSKDVKNISVGTLENEWLVGIVAREKSMYEGWIFFYDGTSYQRVFGDANAPFLSEYDGIIGFGGTSDNWLAVYGAYDGKAYHIREGKPFQDVSQFFGIRAMRGGFQPAVIRAGDGVDARWYVFSLTKGNSVLLKLFQDGTAGNIRGAVDLTQLVMQNAFSEASFMLQSVRGGTTVLSGNMMRNGGSRELWQFVDEGFNVPSFARVSSLNLNNYPAEVWAATIVEADVFEGKSDIEFALSNDGKEWVPARVGEFIAFPDNSQKRLFWRATFTPESGARFSSPYFDKIRVDYKVKFL